MSRRYLLVKRAADLVSALALLCVTLPLLVLISLLILVFDGLPIFFSQERAGYRARGFRLVKFRTMKIPSGTANTEESGRITALGRVLRRTSLDELPSLLNVIRGQMSVVGPRPLPTEYLPIYSARHLRRHDARPGLTGLAQVEGRNFLSWRERFDLDVVYVDSMDSWLDTKILLRTFGRVLTGYGVTKADGFLMDTLTHDYDREVGSNSAGTG